MELSEIPGTVRDMALMLDPTDGAPFMAVTGWNVGGHSAVKLDPSWLRPLAAWFAGEAQPAALGDHPGTLYGRRMDIVGDEETVIWSMHTWARLDCRLPFGTARVSIGPRDKGYGWTVLLSPEARQDVATWLRRADAEHRASPKAAA